MSWIDDRNAEMAALKSRNDLIDAHASATYQSLWKEIIDRVEEAKNKGFPGLLTNGAPEERKIILPPASNTVLSKPRIATVRLDKAKRTISVSGIRASRAFELDTCQGGIVCLTLDGKTVTLEEAAKLILDPLLYPQRQGEIP